MSSYPISTESLDLELYQLACLIAASKNLVACSADHNSFKFLQETFELSEVSKKLISIAVTLRSFLDNDNNPDTVHETVGIINEDTEKKNTKPLKFREACNKIIHALDIQFFDNENRALGLGWSIKLLGSHNNKNWEVTLEIDRFIDTAHLTV
jgi:hypothetical protein